VRFVKKIELDRLVRYDPEVKRYVLNLEINASANQARHVVNVVAREVSNYNILVIPNKQRPPITKKKGKLDSVESPQW
jgi:hypothetical protein